MSIYNRLVVLRNRVDNAYSQIDVQLQRRYDLIPNLVEVAKKFMAHERETLEAVIAARNEAQHRQAAKATGDVTAPAGAEQVLGAAMMKLHAVSEAYPEIKADQQMSELNEELKTTENARVFARQAFNDSVTEYNTAQQLFPAVLFAARSGTAPATSGSSTTRKPKRASRSASTNRSRRSPVCRQSAPSNSRITERKLSGTRTGCWSSFIHTSVAPSATEARVRLLISLR